VNRSEIVCPRKLLRIWREIAAAFILSLFIVSCTRPNTVNFIDDGMRKQIGFNPKGIRFGLGFAVNGKVIELGGTFLLGSTP
jgi:hypothetical protein